MAHFALQIGNVTVEAEDEDMDARQLRRLGEKSIFKILTLLGQGEDDEEE